MLLAERFIAGSGWIEIGLIATYGAFLLYHMLLPAQTAKWRLRSWKVFSLAFFGQLLLGLLLDSRFLMTGRLHFPVPAMILAGPIYRGEMSFMPLLFLSTLVLAGPAWCSQLCYLGALDGWAADRKKPSPTHKHLWLIKNTVLLVVISAALLFRGLNLPPSFGSALVASFGIGGLTVIFFLSAKKGKMVHCIYYCPVGTVVSYLKGINPIRIKIDPACNGCQHCLPACRYEALSPELIRERKVGRTCTHCGDCITTCSRNAIRYKLRGLKSESARAIYLAVSISVHVIFLALARI